MIFSLDISTCFIYNETELLRGLNKIKGSATEYKFTSLIIFQKFFNILNFLFFNLIYQ